MTYDPKLCITAGEVRLLGGKIPEAIPDCAWVHRAALSLASIDSLTVAHDPEIQRAVASFVIDCGEPWEWVSLKLNLPFDHREPWLTFGKPRSES